MIEAIVPSVRQQKNDFTWALRVRDEHRSTRNDIFSY